MEGKRSICRVGLLILAMVITLFLNTQLWTTASQETPIMEGAIVGIESLEDVRVNSTFYISIYVANVTKITGIGLELTWNPEVIELNDIEVSPMAPPGTTLYASNINNTMGFMKASIANTHAPDYITVTDRTPILNLTFTAIGQPGNVTTLDLQNVELSDESYNPYLPEVVEDGFVSIYVLRVVIDDGFVSDDRCDVGSTQTFGFHASWPNGTDVTEGLLIWR